MRIFKWSKFLESNTIHFENSEEFYQIEDKYRLPDSLIKDYFTDLIDEGFEIQIASEMFSQQKIEGTKMSDDGIRISYDISFTKQIENPTNDYSKSYYMDTDKYKDFLDNLSNFIKIFEECSGRISKAEDRNVKTKTVSEVPFIGSGNNLKEFGTFSLRLSMYHYIITNELIEAKKRFQKENSPLKQAQENIVKMLKERGVIEAERLIDSQDIEELGFVSFGFLTNDEIIVIADFYHEDEEDLNDKDRLVIHYDELDRAVKSYEEGYCSDNL